MEQVLLNLAVNARDAMPTGGILTIETAHLEVAADTAAQLNVEPGNYVQLSVSDTGSGMDAATIAHAFEPFFTTKAKGKGTGLGLATVYGIVTEAGGAVTLYSESQLGTTVRVYLRTAEDPAPARRVEDRRQPPSGAGVTVLVVDDEEAIRKVTARILVRNDYSVLQAATGADALSLAADQPVDLLLTDVVMPSMSGLELAERIRALRPDLSVLLMSGYSQGVLGPQRGMDEGVHLIQKPFSEQGLITKLHEMCTGSPVPIDTDP
jgi:two-component system cell cycle sensor histidine kinase/response regulator CckA